MTTLTLKWKRCGDHVPPLPKKAHDSDAGIDLPVVVGHATPDCGVPMRWETWVAPGVLTVFRTGWAAEIPTGWFGLIVLRSSVGKAGWDIESSGVIDASYRGEIMMPMVYRGEGSARVEHGQRMAQMILLPVPRVECVEVETLSDTARGAGGFGSRGR